MAVKRVAALPENIVTKAPPVDAEDIQAIKSDPGQWFQVTEDDVPDSGTVAQRWQKRKGYEVKRARAEDDPRPDVKNKRRYHVFVRYLGEQQEALEVQGATAEPVTTPDPEPVRADQPSLFEEDEEVQASVEAQEQISQGQDPFAALLARQKAVQAEIDAAAAARGVPAPTAPPVPPRP